MKKWFFTFGKGALFQDFYVEVFAPSYIKASETMFCYYGKTWTKQYSREEWFKSTYTVGLEYHLNFLETLIYSEEVDECMKEHYEVIKKYI